MCVKNFSRFFGFEAVVVFCLGCFAGFLKRENSRICMLNGKFFNIESAKTQHEFSKLFRVAFRSSARGCLVKVCMFWFSSVGVLRRSLRWSLRAPRNAHQPNTHPHSRLNINYQYAKQERDALYYRVTKETMNFRFWRASLRIRVVLILRPAGRSQVNRKRRHK